MFSFPTSVINISVQLMHFQLFMFILVSFKQPMFVLVLESKVETEARRKHNQSQHLLVIPASLMPMRRALQLHLVLILI